MTLSLLYFRPTNWRRVASATAKFATCIALGLALLTAGNAVAAGGDFVWARGVGGAGADTGKSIAVDSSGNVYTTGAFRGTADFDPGVGTTTLSSTGSDDIFVSKLDSSGNFVWAIQLGGGGKDSGNAIAVDTLGNVYITGIFVGTVDFDPGAGTANLSSAGGGDIFVTKLDSSGVFVWASPIGGTATDSSVSLAVDSSGNIYTTGSFQNTTDFDPGAGTFELTSLGSWNAFVSKLDQDGAFVWARQFGGTGYSEGHSIVIDGSGNVCTTGIFDETTDFDPGAGTADLVASGTYDAFVSKLDSSGAFLWAGQISGTSTTNATSIAVDSSGSVFTAGHFMGTVDFDPGAGTVDATAYSAFDIFVSKLDSSGAFVWVKQFEGDWIDAATAIALDNAGGIYTAGYFANTVDFDPGAGTFNLSTTGDNDIFVSKLHSSGAFAWAKRLGGPTGEFANAMTVDAVGNVYTTGSFQGTADFDPGAGTAELISAGSDDIFVSKLSATPPDTTPPNVVSITPATTGPTNADSVDFTVTFDEDVVNFDGVGELVLAHNGTASAGATIVGGPSVYTVSITGLVGDGSFTLAVETGSDVEDLSGNALATSVTSATVAVDMMPPDFSLVVAIPSQAQAGEAIAITFATSEPLASDPVVTVNGNPATHTAKVTLTYSYTVLPGDPLGPATIAISGVDEAGNAGTLTSNSALTVVAVAVPEQVPLAAWPLLVGLGVVATVSLRRRTPSRG